MTISKFVHGQLAKCQMTVAVFALAPWAVTQQINTILLYNQLLFLLFDQMVEI